MTKSLSWSKKIKIYIYRKAIYQLIKTKKAHICLYKYNNIE